MSMAIGSPDIAVHDAYAHGWKYRAEFDERRKTAVAYTDPVKQKWFLLGIADCQEQIRAGVVPETTPEYVP